MLDLSVMLKNDLFASQKRDKTSMLFPGNNLVDINLNNSAILTAFTSMMITIMMIAF